MFPPSGDPGAGETQSAAGTPVAGEQWSPHSLLEGRAAQPGERTSLDGSPHPLENTPALCHPTTGTAPQQVQVGLKTNLLAIAKYNVYRKAYSRISSISFTWYERFCMGYFYTPKHTTGWVTPARQQC